VLNYGIPDLAGQTISDLDTTALTQMIRQAILDFEPRLVRQSVQVRLVVDEGQMNHHALIFHIEADLWAQPLPLHLYLRTAVDLETGSVEVAEQNGKGSL
jgi:type VI secretion system protein ImpF